MDDRKLSDEERIKSMIQESVRSRDPVNLAFGIYALGLLRKNSEVKGIKNKIGHYDSKCVSGMSGVNPIYMQIPEEKIEQYLSNLKPTKEMEKKKTCDKLDLIYDTLSLYKT
jgi:hypothetical protein